MVRRVPSAFERPLTSEIGPFMSADGFGVAWYTDARSKFNPFLDQQKIELQTSEANPSKSQQKTKRQTPKAPSKSDGPLLPFVVGPHPAIYKTTIAKPWVLMAFVARNLSFFPFQAQ